MSKYLLEIGTEELPYRFIPQAIEQLHNGFESFLKDNKVEYEKVDQYVDRLSGDALKEAIAQERKLEFAGEGLRRFDLIRTGKFPEKIKLIRDQQKAMIQGLETNG